MLKQKNWNPLKNDYDMNLWKNDYDMKNVFWLKFF
jgi:hypothetical protein